MTFDALNHGHTRLHELERSARLQADGHRDIVWTHDGTRHELMPHLTVMVYPEQIEHLEHLLGSPVVKIALNTDDNVVFNRTPKEDS